MKCITQKYLFRFLWILLLVSSCFYRSITITYAQSQDNWKERNYYREDQLISTETRTFNGLGFIEESTIHYAAGVPIGSRTEYQLDEEGNRISGTRIYEDGKIGKSISGIKYDTNGNMTEIVWESEYGNLIEKYEYDEFGNEISFLLIDSDGEIISQAITENLYDQTQLLIQSICTDIPTNSTDNAKETSYIKTYHYDSSNRLSQITVTDYDNTAVGHYEYVY